MTTSTYTVPADANSGDAIKVVVTDEEGNTAEDTVYVGGFTILKVEPTTAQGERGYKYVRAYFSTGLKSLTPEDLEIRAVKSQQLYSVESVKLSSDGTYADITIAGDTSMSDSSFLMSGVKYGCTVSQGDDTAYLEFELPTFYSDLLVEAVDAENAKITVYGSGRVKKTADTTDRWDYYGEYEIGDIYEGNLGSLLGRHVNMNVNSEGQVTDFYVQDEAIVIGSMKWTADNTASDPANKWYFKDQLTDKKYYYSDTTNASNNATQIVDAVEDSTEGLKANTTYAYAKLVMNPNGTVASAVLADTLNQTIICTTNDEGKITQDADRAVDLSGYTVERDGDYVEAKTIEPGDIIFYNTATKFADIFNYEVSGTIGTVYTTKVDLDGTTYDLANAQRFDADNLKYVDVTQKWLLSLDDEEETTLSLNRQKKVKFVEGVETGVVVTENTDYVLVKDSSAYTDKGTTYLYMTASDGSENSTLQVKVSGLKKIDGVAVGIELDDETKGKDAKLTKIYTTTGDQLATDKATLGLTEGTDKVSDLMAKFDQKDLITVTTKVSDGSIVGIAHKVANGTLASSTGGAQKTSFEPEDTSVETNAAGAPTYSIPDSTKVWILDDTTTGPTLISASMVTFDKYSYTTQTTKNGNVTLFPSTSNKTALDSVVIDNTNNDTILGGTVKTRINGMIVGYETGLATDDQETYELKKLTVWVPNADGGEKVTYTKDDFANQIKRINYNDNKDFDGDYDNDAGITDTVSQLAFNAEGKLLFVSTDAIVEGVADNAPVTVVTDPAGITDSDSATEITLSDGTTKLKVADEALVLQYNSAKNWKVTTISDINLNENYPAGGKVITYHKALGTTDDKVVDVLCVQYQDSTNAITPATYDASVLTDAELEVGMAGTLAVKTAAEATSKDKITYSLGTGANAAFTINASTGEIAWTAAPAAGTYQIPVVQTVAEADLSSGWEVPTPTTTTVTITTKASALGTAVFTFATFTTDIDTSTTGFATFSGTLATSATTQLQASTDGETWTYVGGAAEAGTTPVKTASDANITADTYYRLEIVAPGCVTKYVVMQGEKTAAPVIGLTSTFAVATDPDFTAGAATATFNGTIKDQFGDAIATGSVPVLSTTEMTPAVGNAGSAKATIAIDANGVATVITDATSTANDGFTYTLNGNTLTFTAKANTSTLALS